MKILIILFFAFNFISTVQATTGSVVDLIMTCDSEQDINTILIGSDSTVGNSELYLNAMLSKKSYPVKLQTFGPKTAIQVEFPNYTLLINVTENINLNDAYLKRPSSVSTLFRAQVMKHDGFESINYDADCAGEFKFKLK